MSWMNLWAGCYKLAPHSSNLTPLATTSISYWLFADYEKFERKGNLYDQGRYLPWSYRFPLSSVHAAISLLVAISDACTMGTSCYRSSMALDVWQRLNHLPPELLVWRNLENNWAANQIFKLHCSWFWSTLVLFCSSWSKHHTWDGGHSTLGGVILPLG